MVYHNQLRADHCAGCMIRDCLEDYLHSSSDATGGGRPESQSSPVLEEPQDQDADEESKPETEGPAAVPSMEGQSTVKGLDLSRRKDSPPAAC